MRSLKTITCSFFLIFTVSFSSHAVQKKQQISITVSGAVSLGSYQAGHLYALCEWLKKNRDGLNVNLITGASAGAINALLLSFALSDSTQVTTPDSSIFYQSWIPIGYDSLKGGDDPIGIFSRKIMKRRARDIIRRYLAKPVEKDMDIVLGISATRIEPYIQQSAGIMSLPRLDEKFIVRLKAEKGEKWKIRNYPNTQSILGTPILPLGRKHEVSTLVNLIFVSSGFPGVFPPLDMDLKMVIPKNDTEINWESDNLWDELEIIKGVDKEKVSYLDGGIFDNTPLRLAYQLAREGLYRDSGEYLWEIRGGGRADTSSADSLFYLYLDPDNHEYPSSLPKTVNKNRDLISALVRISGNLVNATRSNELYSLLEEAPHLIDRIKYTENYSPHMCGYLLNFFGFFEKDLRLFDFYLGMYDAERYVNNKLIKAIKNANPTLQVSPIHMSEIMEAGTAENHKAKFKYISDILDTIKYLSEKEEALSETDYNLLESLGKGSYPEGISHDTMEMPVAQLQSLMQTSLDMLWARWQVELDNNSMSTFAAYDKWKDLINRPPKISGQQVKPWKAKMERKFSKKKNKLTLWEKNIITPLKNNKEFTAFLELLCRNRYRFSCIGDNNTNKAEPQRREVHKFLSEFVKESLHSLQKGQEKHTKMGWASSYLLKLSQPRLTNLVFYSPPKHILSPSIGIGGFSLSYSRKWGKKFHDVRWPVEIGINHIPNSGISLEGMSGLEWGPWCYKDFNKFINIRLLFLVVGGACPLKKELETVYAGIQSGFSLTLLEGIKLRFLGGRAHNWNKVDDEWHLGDLGDWRYLWKIQLGVQMISRH